jgi:TolB protein
MTVPIPICCVVLLATAAVGRFDGHSDVGTVERPGASTYDEVRREYRVTGSGANIWGTRDAFHFLYRRISGDVTLTADLRFEGKGKDPHRKACLMVREGLEPDAPYVDVAVHGDGLVSLQYRKVKGGPTEEVKAPSKAPPGEAVHVTLRRRGDAFTFFLGDATDPAGSVTVKLTGPTYAGLAVCSHDASVSETATFSNVVVEADAE